eukprot:GHRR01014678.1.p1 GENE.GHRR01014678.1~~GHRR01014678.1.p1  ORF type:complete len:175 (+),score=45.44 GHRR01014678.1:120-644(+)
MERTNDWIGAVDSACLYLSLSPDECKKCKQAILLKEKRERSQFATVADGVIQSIHKLREFIATNKRDYLASGKITEQSKDQVEEQVGLAVQAITQHLEALKNGVIAAQRPADNSQPLVNAETAAHLHGAVSKPQGALGCCVIYAQVGSTAPFAVRQVCKCPYSSSNHCATEQST